MYPVNKTQASCQAASRASFAPTGKRPNTVARNTHKNRLAKHARHFGCTALPHGFQEVIPAPTRCADALPTHRQGAPLQRKTPTQTIKCVRSYTDATLRYVRATVSGL